MYARRLVFQVYMATTVKKPPATEVSSNHALFKAGPRFQRRLLNKRYLPMQ